MTSHIRLELNARFTFGLMSIARQFTKKHLVIAALICIPLLSLADAKRDKKNKRAIAAAPSAAKADTGRYKAIGAPMPPLRVVYPKKAVHTTETVANDANLFVMMFNPTCEHCEEMTFAFRNNIGLFKKSHILLMAAPGMGNYLEYFENNTKLKATPKIMMGLDSSNFIN